MAYDRRAAQAYERARSLSLEDLAEWRIALAPYLGNGSQLPVVDVGAGNGVFAYAIATWFDRDVIGIEPSEEMRSLAIGLRSHARIRYVLGDAAHLPVPDESCGAAWLSTVVHHVPNLEACAWELRRALRRPAKVLIRSAFPGHLDAITLFKYFESAKRVAETFPSVDAVVDAFQEAGFRMESFKSVPQRSAPSLQEFYAQVRAGRKADSTLRTMPDEAFEHGLEILRHDVSQEKRPTPIIDCLSLLVLTR